MRLGIIARMDDTGLGNQSKVWVDLLRPDKVIVIDSVPFNGNKQNPDWYENHPNVLWIYGFIKSHQIDNVLDGIDTLLTFEVPYSYPMIERAKERGVKVVIQNNWEFTDYLEHPQLELPDRLINHSLWHLDDQKRKFPDISGYCPTPVDIDGFKRVRTRNLKRRGKFRFLHIAGRTTYKDRNGTEDLIKAVSMIDPKIDFELVIKTQTTEVSSNDMRVVIDDSHVEDFHDLYEGLDAVVMPRRYAGACLPMQEALASGLPVIMTDIPPNNLILPSRWLVESERVESFTTRTKIDVFSAKPEFLAGKMIDFINMGKRDLKKEKELAHRMAKYNYSPEIVKRIMESYL